MLSKMHDMVHVWKEYTYMEKVNIDFGCILCSQRLKYGKCKYKSL